MSDRIPSIETPELRTAPFRLLHILLDVVGFTHDPIESPNLGYRSLNRRKKLESSRDSRKRYIYQVFEIK